MSPVNPYEAALCAWMREAVGLGWCGHTWDRVLDAAEAGDERMLQLVDTFVKQEALRDEERFGRLVSRLADKGVLAAQRFADAAPAVAARPEPAASPVETPAEDRAIPLTTEDVFKVLRKRAGSISRPQMETPERLLGHLFEGMEGMRGVRMGLESDPTAEQLAWELLAGAMAKEMVRALKPGRGELHIPEPPLSMREDEEFLDAMGVKLGAEPKALMAWRESPMWLPILTTLFTAFLAEGVSPYPTRTERDERETAIDLKRRWWHVLDAAGMHSEDVGKAVRHLYPVSDEERRIDIIAEISRFDSTVRPYLQGDDVAVRLLQRDLIKLHYAEPGLDGEVFLRLLIPYLERMSTASIRDAFRLSRPNLTEFDRFVARNALAWHTDPLPALAGRIEEFIRQSQKYKDLQTLFREAYALPRGGKGKGALPPALEQKMRQMRDEGVNVMPLLDAIVGKFPATGSTIAGFVESGKPPPAPAAPAAPAVDLVAAASGQLRVPTGREVAERSLQLAFPFAAAKAGFKPRG